jgi:hypothetical protein
MTDVKKRIIRDFVLTKLKYNYGLTEKETCILDNYIDEAIERTQYCISHVKDKYINDSSEFSIYNSTQASVYMYYLTNSIYRGELSNNSAPGRGGVHLQMYHKLISESCAINCIIFIRDNFVLNYFMRLKCQIFFLGGTQ